MLAAAIACAADPILAQEKYPTRNVKIISPAPPGALSDTLPRLLATELASALQSTFIVENKPGAGGTIGAVSAARAPADGYTLLLATGGIMHFNPYFLPQLSYDPQKDYNGIALLASTPLYLVVRADSPYMSFADLVTAAKAKKGQLACGTLGNGSTVAVATALLARANDLELIEVPFAGYSPALSELLGGRLAFTMVDGASVSRIENGQLRALAVTTPQRAKRLPKVPTLKELGSPVELAVWFGLYAPAGIPAIVAQRLSTEVKLAMDKPAIRTQLDSFGLEGGTLFGENFHTWHLSEYARWADILPKLGLKHNS
jgi:tripartite-type tricarboxylate transporter receptor subunit TctC